MTSHHKTKKEKKHSHKEKKKEHRDKEKEKERHNKEKQKEHYQEEKEKERHDKEKEKERHEKEKEKERHEKEKEKEHHQKEKEEQSRKEKKERHSKEKEKEQRHLTSEIILISSSSDDEDHKKLGPKAPETKRNESKKNRDAARSDKAKGPQPVLQGPAEKQQQIPEKKQIPEKQQQIPEKQQQIPEKQQQIPEKQQQIPEKQQQIPEKQQQIPEKRQQPSRNIKQDLGQEPNVSLAASIESLPEDVDLREMGPRFLERPFLVQVKDAVFIIMTGAMFERNFAHTEADEKLGRYDPPRVRMMFVGSIFYTMQIAFFLFSGLVGTVFLSVKGSQCRIELLMFLVIVGFVNTVGSALFCLLHGSPLGARIMLYIIWLIDFVWLMCALAFELGTVTHWSDEIEDDGKMNDIPPDFYCPIVPYVLAIMMVVILFINAVAQIVFIALYFSTHPPKLPSIE